MDRDRPASAATPATPEPAAADPLVIEVRKPQLMPLVSVIPDTIRWMPPPARRRPVMRVVALEAAE